jgi:hypothetical protein
MLRGEESAYDKLFSYGCPKFITASPPDWDNPSAGPAMEVRVLWGRHGMWTMVVCAGPCMLVSL